MNFWYLTYFTSQDRTVDDILTYDLSLHNRDVQKMTYRQYYVMLRNQYGCQLVKIRNIERILCEI